MQQRTLRQSIRATGVGVHKGEAAHIVLRPAPINTGIVFCRMDLPGTPAIRARYDAVSDTAMCTVLKHNQHTVATVEHLLSALSAFGIDNLYVDVNGPELPIMDGSAAPFAFLLESAGIILQTAIKQFIVIKKEVKVVDGDKSATLLPYDGFRLSYQLDYDHPFFAGKKNKYQFNFNQAIFVREISRARTFGFLKDAEKMRALNLALGANLENTVVIGDTDIVNEAGLRYEDECVRHKLLDAIGDLYLAGHNIIGEFVGIKSGHAMNNKLLHALMEQTDAWELVSFDESKKAPVAYHQWIAA